jgi:hypothetical protein
VCDGQDLRGNTCQSLGYDVGSLSCLPNCSDFDPSSCGYANICGNGVKEKPEACDGNADAACPGRCNSDCLCPTFEVIGNGSFNTTLESWTFSAKKNSATASWNQVGWQNGGAVQIKSPKGQSLEGKGHLEQSLISAMAPGSLVKLSYAWKKGYGTKTPSKENINVSLIKPDATSVDIETISGAPAAYNTWYSVRGKDISKLFDQTGNYKLQFSYNYITGNNKQAESYALIDEVSLMVTPPAQRQVDESRIALLNLTAKNSSSTAPASNSDYNSVVQALEAMGLPYLVTANVSEATSYKIIVTASAIKASTLTADEKTWLRSYVQNGGFLITSKFEDPELIDLFGIATVAASDLAKTISFSPEALSLPCMKYLDDPLEKTISLAGAASLASFDTRIYTASTGSIIATYNDGQGAMIMNTFGRGKTLAIGSRLADLIMRDLTNTDDNAQRSWSNGFEPSADVIMLILRGIYETSFPRPLMRHQIPFSYEGALLITHDVDAKASSANAIEFMNLEKSFGVLSTYNITTKYFKDGMDSAYYNSTTIPYIQELRANGFDVESHSVGHFLNFWDIPLGDPTVTYATYQPHYTKGILYDATLNGEIRVSKERLDQDIPGQQTVSFRAGYLDFHSALAEVLEQAGYLYDSSRSANDVLTNYPYFLMLGNSMAGQVSNILEIPMTISDSILTETTIDSAVAKWLDVIARNNRNNAVTNLLIHTSRTTYKLESENRILQALADQDIWIGDMTSFGNFWRERQSLRLSAETITYPGLPGLDLLITLNRDASQVVPGTTLRLIDTRQDIKSYLVQDAKGVRLCVKIQKKGNAIYLEL